MKYMTVEQLADLAREVELKDPIDWGMLSITEEDAYKLMASSVLEQLEPLADEDRMIVAMATITKMLVENFVLNLKIEGKT